MKHIQPTSNELYSSKYGKYDPTKHVQPASNELYGNIYGKYDQYILHPKNVMNVEKKFREKMKLHGYILPPQDYIDIENHLSGVMHQFLFDDAQLNNGVGGQRLKRMLAGEYLTTPYDPGELGEYKGGKSVEEFLNDVNTRTLKNMMEYGLREAKEYLRWVDLKHETPADRYKKSQFRPLTDIPFMQMPGTNYVKAQSVQYPYKYSKK